MGLKHDLKPNFDVLKALKGEVDTISFFSRWQAITYTILKRWSDDEFYNPIADLMEGR